MYSNKEKEILLSMINKYKDMPFLWKKTHIDYTNKDLRNEAFEVLLEIYKTYNEDATVQTVKKKIENMRTNYSKEIKKVLASKYNGSREDEYVPTLWYFDNLSFLENWTSCQTSTDSLENEYLSSDYEIITVAESTKGKGHKRKKKKTQIVKQKETTIEKGHALETAEKLVTNSSQKDEQWQAYGRSIGFQLKDLNEHQLVFCQKIISDAIFCARLNKLNEKSYIVTPSNEAKFNRRHLNYDHPSSSLNVHDHSQLCDQQLAHDSLQSSPHHVDHSNHSLHQPSPSNSPSQPSQIVVIKLEDSVHSLSGNPGDIKKERKS